jgi:O-antigen/teichoic acid export membrane protein
VYLAVAQGTLLATGFVISVVLARGLGPVDFGIYGVVISVLAWFERFLNVGIAGGTAILVPRLAAQRETIEKTTRSMLLLWSLPLFALLWATAPALAAYFKIPSGAGLFRVASFHVPAMALYFAYEGIVTGRRRFDAMSAIQMVQSTAKMGGVLLLLAVGLSLRGVLVAHVLATAVTAVLAAMAFPLGRARASRATMRTILALGLPMAAYSMALVALLNLSLWQLRASPSVDGAVVGLYVTSLNLTRILMVVPSTISVVLPPSLSWAVAASRPQLATKYIQEAGRFALMVTVPVVVLLGIDAEAVMQLLYGPQYAGGGRILALLCVAFAAVAFFDIHLHALMADHRPALAAAVLGALVPLLLVFNHVLIPRYGGAGAAASAMIVCCLGAVCAAALVARRFGSILRLQSIARVGVAAVTIGALSVRIPVAGPWIVVKLAALGLVYLAILWATGEITKHDLRPFAVWKADRA